MKPIARLLALFSLALVGFGAEAYGRARVTGVTVAPSNPPVGVGQTVQLTATASFSDGSSEDVTTDAAWTTSDRQIVTVGNQPSNKGNVAGVAAGSAVVTAIYQGARGQASVTAFVVP